MHLCALKLKILLWKPNITMHKLEIKDSKTIFNDIIAHLIFFGKDLPRIRLKKGPKKTKFASWLKTLSLIYDLY